MKILFLGGTGNISAECAALLHEQGHEVLVVSRGRSSVPVQYRTIRADRRDRQRLFQELAQLEPEVVLNFLGPHHQRRGADLEPDLRRNR